MASFDLAKQRCCYPATTSWIRYVTLLQLWLAHHSYRLVEPGLSILSPHLSVLNRHYSSNRVSEMAPLIVFPSIVSLNAWNVVAVVASIISLIVLANVLQQTLLKKPNEPPVVFHWLPVVGSTVTYGLDPFKFFFQCQAKVRICGPRDMVQTLNARMLTMIAEVWRHFHLHLAW